MGKESACNAGDTEDAGLIPGSGRSPGGGHGNPLQYSCLENPMDRGAWRAAVHGVTKSQTQLKRLGIRALTAQGALLRHHGDLNRKAVQKGGNACICAANSV